MELESPPLEERKIDQNEPEPQNENPAETSQENTDDIINKLKVIFSYYASFGDKMNINTLKSAKFHKLFQESGIDYKLNIKKKLDLIFSACVKNKSGMLFETFLDSLPQIALTVFPTAGSDRDALQTLLHTYLIPQYQQIASIPQNIGSNQKFDIEATPEVLEIFSSIMGTLMQLYLAYFPWEKSSSESQEIILNKSSNTAMRFLSEFDVCPSIISKSAAFNICVSTINSEKQIILPIIPKNFVIGISFTFSKFLDFLYKISFFAYESKSTDSCEAAEKLCFLLERMELSNGFFNIEKKTNKPHSSKTFLIPPNNILKKIMESKIISEQNEDSKSSMQKSNINKSQMPFNERPSMIYEQSKELYPLVEKYLENLQPLFEKYCSFGDPLNTTHLRSSKFIKLLRDAGILSSTTDISTSQVHEKNNFLRQMDADIIYSKITSIKYTQKQDMLGSSISQSKFLDSPNKFEEKTKAVGGKMNFDMFLVALKMIAEKILPDDPIEKSMTFIIENYLLKLKQNESAERDVTNSQLLELMNILKDSEVVKLLSLVHSSMQPYFKYYANAKNLMTIDAFLKFCSDFSIFPDIITKPKLSRFFNTLVSIYNSTLNSNKDSKINIGEGMVNAIDEHLFIEAIALCAMEVPYKEPEPDCIEKIIFLLERMSQARGNQIVHKSYGNTRMVSGTNLDILSTIRIHYPQYFKIKPKSNSKKGFLEVFNQ